MTPSFSSTDRAKGETSGGEDLGIDLGGDILEASWGMAVMVRLLRGESLIVGVPCALASSTILWSLFIELRLVLLWDNPDIPRPSPEDAITSLFSVEEPRRLLQNPLRVLPQRSLP